MTRFPTAARRIGVAAALATAATFGAVTSAMAAPNGPAAAAQPSDCEVRTYTLQYRVIAFCNEGTGQYRATTRCDQSWASDYNRYGPWRPAGGGDVSRAQCDSGDRPFNGSYQTR